MNIWQLEIIDSPAMWIVYAVAAALLVTLVVRRWSMRSFMAAIIGAFLGAVVGGTVWFLANQLLWFGDPLPAAVLFWALGGFAAVGFALGSLTGAKAWRKVVAIVAIVVFLVATAVGVNAYYGINKALGSLFGFSDQDAIILPDGGATTAAPSPDVPLYESWQPPAGMPSAGTVGSQAIPGTVSRFAARDAGIYLPPAAQVPNAPALPFVIMMMGFPGNPDPSYIAAVLDEYAAKNNGLAPIAIVADQLGSTGDDPACADSAAYGNARTYITTDVVNWAKRNLNIIDDPAYWVMAGYSNGGGCAITYGASYPEEWHNILDISGEEFPGSEHVDDVVANIYGGDQAAFGASKPINIMQSAPPGTYDHVTAIFTAGELDPDFSAVADKVSAVAQQVGMDVTRYEIPGADHVVTGLNGGLREGFDVLYPVLGLSAPTG